jgi:hypothetical protein
LLSQKKYSVDDQEAEKLLKRLEEMSLTVSAEENFDYIADVKDILRIYPVVLTGSHLARDKLSSQFRYNNIDNYDPWKIAVKEDSSVVSIEAIIKTSNKIILISLAQQKRPFGNGDRKSHFKITRIQECFACEAERPDSNIGNPYTLVRYENGRKELVQLKEGCDADLVVLPGHDVEEVARNIFADQISQFPRLQLELQEERRSTGSLFSIRAKYPLLSNEQTVMDFFGFMPKQIYQVPLSKIFCHHVHVVRAYHRWNSEKGTYETCCDPTYLYYNKISYDFFCISSTKISPSEILMKYIQRGIDFGNLNKVAELGQKYLWLSIQKDKKYSASSTSSFGLFQPIPEL